MSLAKRVIPCLDVKDGRTVKGTNFVNLRDAGDPVELAAKYAEENADELVFLDISATLEKRKTMVDMVRNVAKEVNIPFSVGGGISSIQDVDALLHAGADKISINSSAVRNPNLIDELALAFGSQCVILAVDSKLQDDGHHRVFVAGGTKATERYTLDWIKEAEQRGAGEVLLTSMDHDGTKSGFALNLHRELRKVCNLPIIASGGAGSAKDFLALFQDDLADAGLAASIFHYKEISIPELKVQLKQAGIDTRL